MDKATAERRAAEIAQDIEGPLGRIPLERVFSRHIDFFCDLREAGVTWPQIAALLARASVFRKDGLPLAANQIRSTISRIVGSHDPDRLPTATPFRKQTKPNDRSNAAIEKRTIQPVPQPRDRPKKLNDLREKMARALRARDSK